VSLQPKELFGRLWNRATTKKENFMASDTYDIITVGGGLGGSTLAKVMAEHGARVL
jgi:ribulose 1,5-bisphosphate synthetase/thiazole synthase